MRRLVLAWLLVIAAVAAVPAPIRAQAESGGGPRVASLHPNPVAPEDVGEFVVLRFPTATNLSGWTLTDGERRVPLGNGSVEGRVAFSASPARARPLTEAPVRRLSAGLRLANGGETVRLRHRGVTVDAVSYRDAPEGESLNATTGRWQPPGATDLPVVTAGPTRATLFVLPDAPGVPVGTLRDAERRVLLAGYTLTSRRVRDALLAAHRRNVTVRVLVDGDPVGGMTRREAHILDALAAAGVEVRALGGPYARYAFHHAKYAVVDDRALVLTENWKPAGTGGRSSRGWGVVVEDGRVARSLVRTFRADFGWRGARPWRTVREGRSFQPPAPANGTFPSRFRPRRVRVRRVSVLTAPDNAGSVVVARLRRANDSIRVQQVSIGSPRQRFLRATVRAARRGVRVRVLLSSAWYVREDNRRLVERLNDLAGREGLPLRARLADPRGRFEKIHAKGAVVDDTVVLGSLNWNNHSTRENREVVLLLEGEAVARYYRRVFRADWRGGAWRLPVGVLVVLLAGVVGALLLARRFRFESGIEGGAAIGWD